MPPKKRKSFKVDEDDSSNEEKKTKSAKLNDNGPDIFDIFSKKSSNAQTTKIKFDLEWTEFGEATNKNIRPLIYLSSKSQPGKNKIAAFDIDNTIIVTKSGKKFATSK
jgi:bifunctional polynucleotide phosphatase/kinase